MIRVCILLVMITLLPLSAKAQETELETVVPSVHTLQIELTGNGTVTVDSVTYTRSAVVEVGRHSTPKVAVKADEGSALKSVLLGGQDITGQLQNGVFLLPEIHEDTEIAVFFEAVVSPPETGDTGTGREWFTVALLSVAGLCSCLYILRSRQKNSC